MEPRKDSASKFFIENMDHSRFLEAAPVKSSSSKLSTFSKLYKTFLDLEQPERFSISRDVKPFIVLGSTTRLVQFSKSNKVSPKRNRIDGGSSIISVPSRKRSNRHSAVPTISRKFFSLEQPEIRVVRLVRFHLHLARKSSKITEVFKVQ